MARPGFGWPPKGYDDTVRCRGRWDGPKATNPLDTAPWKARLAQNEFGGTKPTVPIFQYHALFDEMVAYPQAAALRRTWCSKGANVTWATFPVAEHATGIVEGVLPAMDFLSARFAGQPAVSNCALP